MKILHMATSLIIMLTAGYFFIVSLSFPPGMGGGVPGPAFFPQLILILVILLSIIYLVQVIREKDPGPIFTELERSKLLTLLIISIAILIFVFFLGKISFFILAPGFLLLICLILRLHWRTSLLTTIILCLMVYLIFMKGFKVII